MFKKLKSMFGGGSAEESKQPSQEQEEQLSTEQQPEKSSEATSVVAETQVEKATSPADEIVTTVEQTNDSAEVESAPVVDEPAAFEASEANDKNREENPVDKVAEKDTDIGAKESVGTAELIDEVVSDDTIEKAPNEVVDAIVEEESASVAPPATVAEPAPPVEEKKGFFARIKSGLSKTKANLTEQLSNIFLGAKEIDDDLLEDIETLLLTADVGVAATSDIISRLTDKVARKQLNDPQALQAALKEELAALLHQSEQPLDTSCNDGPYVILMVGVNGVGKTTTIGKLAKKFQSEGKSVMLAAGDTFRAAAVEQLQVWGERNDVPVVAQHTGADSASVIFDAVQSAQAKNIDILIADTAGRLQNKDNLMQELEKVVRVTKKLAPEAPHEVMLVLDAGTGQNALSQAKIFKESVGVTGISLTKLDGTAKGGVIFAIAKQMDLPIRFIGVGEQIDDLRPFKSQEFVDALFD
jgi:fused signal recognition particle receptor